MQMLHLRIGDMAQLMEAMQKDPLTFLNENVLHSLTPATALEIIKYQKDEHSLYDQLLELVFSADDANNIRSVGSLESILLHMAKSLDDHNVLRSYGKSEANTDIDHEETIASCVNLSHETATHEWSKIERDVAQHALTKLRELVDGAQENAKQHTISAASKSKELIQGELAKIKVLEDELAKETSRLTSYKRAQQILRSSLEIERCNPITGLSEEVRKSTVPCFELIDNSLTDCTFPLLDGSAEVTMNIDIGLQQMNAIGFSIKDGGSAMKLIQSILLGTVDVATDEVTYPTPIRDCVSSSIIPEDQNLCDAFREASKLFSRMDSLLKSVKCLEAEYLCTIDAVSGGDVHLAFSSHQEGEVIKVDFVFASMLTDTWTVTSVPNDVRVSICTAEGNRDELCAQLQQQANDMLNSSCHIDPIVLNRVVDGVMSVALESKH